MRELLAYLFCAIIVLYGIKESITTAFYEKTLKNSLNKVLYYFSILLTFFLIITNLNWVMSIVIKIKLQYLSFIYNTKYTNIIILIGLFFVSQNIIYVLLKLLSINNIFLIKKYEKSSSLLSIISGFLGAVKGLIIVLIVFIGIVTFNKSVTLSKEINIFNNLSSYNKVKTLIISNYQLSEDIYSTTDKIIPTNNTIIYYNGVTLEEGIQSNDEIDKKAKELIKFCEDDRSKAKRIYTWIGTNIEYDSEKAYKVLKEEEFDESGSISAWKSRKGICFDYACLYVSMAKAANLKVRLITGEAFDGESYGSHAWNQVYLADEDSWINVDSTFYVSGDYFDTNLFSEDHIEEEIAGEW